MLQSCPTKWFFRINCGPLGVSSKKQNKKKGGRRVVPTTAHDAFWNNPQQLCYPTISSRVDQLKVVSLLSSRHSCWSAPASLATQLSAVVPPGSQHLCILTLGSYSTQLSSRKAQSSTVTLFDSQQSCYPTLGSCDIQFLLALVFPSFFSSYVTQLPAAMRPSSPFLASFIRKREKGWYDTMQKWFLFWRGRVKVHEELMLCMIVHSWGNINIPDRKSSLVVQPSVVLIPFLSCRAAHLSIAARCSVLSGPGNQLSTTISLRTT